MNKIPNLMMTQITIFQPSIDALEETSSNYWKNVFYSHNDDIFGLLFQGVK